MFKLRSKHGSFSAERFTTRADAEAAQRILCAVHLDTEIVTTLNGAEVPQYIVDHVRVVKRTYLIEAIKLVRSFTGAGLKESKDFVESL